MIPDARLAEGVNGATEVARIEFDVTLDLLTWGDLIFLEKPRSWEYARDLAARFMVDAQGVSVPFEQAKRILNGLSEARAKQTVSEVVTAIAEARQNAVPPTNGG